MSPFQLEINLQGYLILPQNVAGQHFPEDVCIVFFRSPELWLMPIHSSNAGGLLLKQRNSNGDRSLLIHEFLPLNWQPGNFPAFWDNENFALRIAVNYG